MWCERASTASQTFLRKRGTSAPSGHPQAAIGGAGTHPQPCVQHLQRPPAADTKSQCLTPTFLVVQLLQEGEAFTGNLLCPPRGYPDRTGKGREAQEEGLAQGPKADECLGQEPKQSLHSLHDTTRTGRVPDSCHSALTQAYTSIFERIHLSVSPQQFCVPSRGNLHVITPYVSPPAAPWVSAGAFTLNPASFRPSRCLPFLLPQPRLRALHHVLSLWVFTPRQGDAECCFVLAYLNRNILNRSFVMFLYYFDQVGLITD